jgi:hypothetical protein
MAMLRQKRSQMFAVLPLLALPVFLYNVLAVTLSVGFWDPEFAVRLSAPLFTITMVSHVPWPVSLGDLLLMGALVILFVELLRSTSSRQLAIINSSLSMVLLISCLIEFLFFPAFATSIFFLLVLMVLLDVLAGLIVTVMSAPRSNFAAVDRGRLRSGR